MSSYSILNKIKNVKVIFPKTGYHKNGSISMNENFLLSFLKATNRSTLILFLQNCIYFYVKKNLEKCMSLKKNQPTTDWDNLSLCFSYSLEKYCETLFL